MPTPEEKIMGMEPYKNLGGRSGVIAYEIGLDYITVLFEDETAYRYDYANPGPEATKDMKQLAIAGRGLNTYLNQFIRSSYSARLK